MEGLVTPPFRVGQNDTHVYVEAQCPEASTTVKPEAACDETVFVLKHAPYYLPLHFPAPIQSVEQIHQMGSVVRVDLVKADPGLEFIGLDDIQPTMYAESDAQQSASSSSKPRPDDPEAQSMLKEVLERENMSAIKDEKRTKKEKDQSKEFGILFRDLNSDTLQANRETAEASETENFDEQAYLDAYVDEYGEVAEALEWTYEPAHASTSQTASTTHDDEETPQHLRLLLLDTLYAYHLAILMSSGPPIYAWLLCSLSRSLSSPPAPPFQGDDSVQSVLRAGYRRGLAFPLHRSWKLCERAASDVAARLKAGGEEVGAAFTDMITCLADAEKEAPEGPDEAERWGVLKSTILQPLSKEVQAMGNQSFSSLAQDVQSSVLQLNKASVAESWDLELLEQMAQDVLAEASAEQEARMTDAKANIEQTCLQLTPPFDLQEGYDAFATPVSDEARSWCDKWRAEEAGRLLRRLSSEYSAYSIRRLWSGAKPCAEDTALRSKILIATARFLQAFPWSTATSRQIALTLIARPGLRPSVDTIEVILRQHVRSLFVSPLPGSVNEQGRLRHQDGNLTASMRAGIIDEGELWKGKRAADVPDVEMRRNVGAGSHAVLGLCLSGIRHLSKKDTTSAAEGAWERFWPVLIPPLMTMIQDSDPLWRCRGTSLLNRYLLKPEPPATGSSMHHWGFHFRRESIAAISGGPSVSHGSALEMLQRANLIPLLQETLYTSVTYLSHSSGAALLDDSIASLIKFSDTYPAKSREQVEEYMKIIQNGILRTWTFMPRNMTVGDDSSDETDILSITFDHLSTLTTKLGMFSARFLDVVLEFLVAQITGLYDSLAMEAASGSIRKTQIKSARTSKAVKSMIAIIQACLPSANNFDASNVAPHPPNLSVWCTPSLIAIVKVWLALYDHDLVDNEGRRSDRSTKELLTQLQHCWKTWCNLFPEKSSEVYKRVYKTDPSVSILTHTL